jgi:Spy/CpxP family protein refolding chaperone
MKAVKEMMSANKFLSVSLIFLVLFSLLAIAAVEFYPASVQAAGFRAMKRSPEQITTMLKVRLNLTDRQVKAIEPIVNESMAKTRELMNELRQVRQSTDAKIVAVLTKEQAVQFQKIQDQRRERMWRRAGGSRRR